MSYPTESDFAKTFSYTDLYYQEPELLYINNELSSQGREIMGQLTAMVNWQDAKPRSSYMDETKGELPLTNGRVASLERSKLKPDREMPKGSRYLVEEVHVYFDDKQLTYMDWGKYTILKVDFINPRGRMLTSYSDSASLLTAKTLLIQANQAIPSATPQEVTA